MDLYVMGKVTVSMSDSSTSMHAVDRGANSLIPTPLLIFISLNLRALSEPCTQSKLRSSKEIEIYVKLSLIKSNLVSIEEHSRIVSVSSIKVLEAL